MPESKSAKVRILFVTLCVLCLAPSHGVTSAFGQSTDWKQWGGPHRDFKADVKRLANGWPESGPHKLWKRDLGEGYSSIVAENAKIYTMYRKGEEEIAVALDAATGKTVWEYRYPARVTNDMTRAPGPRSTPLIAGNFLYTVGTIGKFHCLDKRTGKPVWSHDLWADFKGYVQDELYASSPLAYKNLVIVPVGASGASIIAFNQKDGRVVWKKQDFKTSYSSPILINVGGQQQLVAVMEEQIIGLNPDTGDLLWSHPHKNRTRTNVSTPIWGDDNLLFCSSAYDSGSRVLKLTRDGNQTKVEEVWYQRSIRVHFGNAIRIGDTIYGSSGDFGPTPFTAVDVKTGKQLWSDRNIMKSSLVYAAGHLIMLDEDGNLSLATPTPTGLNIHSKIQLLTNKAWTPPTLAGTKLYIRDQKTIMALDLK